MNESVAGGRQPATDADNCSNRSAPLILFALNLSARNLRKRKERRLRKLTKWFIRKSKLLQFETANPIETNCATLVIAPGAPSTEQLRSQQT